VLDHLDLNVSDLERSRTFYEPLLEQLGYRAFESGSGWCSFIDAPGGFYLVLVQTSSEHAASGFHRKRIGVNHLAFTMPSPASVEALHGWLIEAGIPALYEGAMQMGDRTAVFVEDPDRMKLEFVFRPTA